MAEFDWNSDSDIYGTSDATPSSQPSRKSSHVLRQRERRAKANHTKHYRRLNTPGRTAKAGRAGKEGYSESNIRLQTLVSPRRKDSRTTTHPFENSGDTSDETVHEEFLFKTGSTLRFYKLLEHREDYQWQDHRTYEEPRSSSHPLAYELMNSVPNMPGLEFSRDFVDWLLPTANNTHLIVKTIHNDPQKDSQKDPQKDTQDLQAIMVPCPNFQNWRWKNMLRFLDQFQQTKTSCRWKHHYEQEGTLDLIKNCADFQAEFLRYDDPRHPKLKDIELVVFDALRALALSHQIADIMTLLNDSDFDTHRYTKPTILQAPNGKMIQVTKYDQKSHGEYSMGHNQLEGNKLSSILKHVVLTCEENVSDVREGPVIAVVICLLNLVAANLASAVECVNTFDIDKLETVLQHLCAFLERSSDGVHHPFRKRSDDVHYVGKTDRAYEIQGMLFQDLYRVWNDGGFWQEHENDPLLTKLRAVAFGKVGFD
ncbi:uncharacterized protein RSE6_03314 [Rhynchosporium secalis]|uniref:Uncharacterized protein n=1 Tax=Rhynchosporium secalis TaxID=38038 RepID=A0A1E1M2G5_RHYSE|nr:uncharacterized protein RSE6_03314 [Rhynchosporium secalis]